MLETEIKKLTAAIEALTEAMTTAPVTEAPVETPVVEAPVEVAEPVETLVAEDAMDKDTLTRLCLELSRHGHKDSIKAKLESYGVKRVTELVGGDNYGSFCDWVVESTSLAIAEKIVSRANAEVTQ
jgi:hypothetical protein